MGMRWILGVVPVAALACGDHGSDEALPDTGPRAELVLPMVPKTTESRWLPPPADPIVGADGGLTYAIADSLDVAIGDGYPTALDVTLRAYPITGDALCGAYVEPETTIDAIEPVAGLDVIAPAADRLRITHSAEGHHTVVVRGHYRFEAPPDCPDAPSEAAFELALDVAVRRPTGVVFHLPETCAAAGVPRLQSGAALALGLELELIDGDGEAFVPKNADPARPVELRVTADASTELDSYDASLATLVAAGAPTTVLVDALDDTLAFELVEPADIDAMDVVFTLTGSTLTELAPGTTYGQDGWAQHTFASVQPAVSALYSAGDPLCSQPLAESFELASATADTCTIVGELAHGFKTVEGFLVPQSADIVADGRCELSLRAEQFAAGAGVSAELSATFVNTAELGGGARD